MTSLKEHAQILQPEMVPIDLELWVCGSIVWFMQTQLQAPPDYLPAPWAQQLARQLTPQYKQQFTPPSTQQFAAKRECSPHSIDESTLSFLASRLPQLSLAELALPVSLQRLVAQKLLSKSQLFIVGFCAALNNHYELNLALQELQGAQSSGAQGQGWPRLYLLCDLLRVICGEEISPSAMAQWPLVRCGLLQLHGNGPLALASVQLNMHYWQGLLDAHHARASLTLANDLTAFDNKTTTHSLHSNSETNIGADMAVAMRLGELRQLHLCGSRCAALSWLQNLALSLDKTLVLPVGDNLPGHLDLLCIAHQWLPVIEISEGVSSNTVDERADEISPRVILHTSPLGVAQLAQLQQQPGALVHHLPITAREERIIAWQRWVTPVQAEEFARRWLIAPDEIHPLAASLPRAQWQQSLSDMCTGIANARRKLAPSHLQNLAFLVPQVVTDQALVLSPKIHSELAALQARCEQREEVFHALGPALAGAGHGGVKALLYGESGTGKTLAALYLASQLAAPLYRLDLGAVLNKYVGETEKNIHQLMLEAAQGDFILLIDEADALFAKRGDGDSGGERFANMLTNYLLARIEQHPGIVLMTTNGLGRIDSAFMRRFDRVIEFHPPTLDERTRLWQNHLGARSPGEQACKQLASLCDLSGGFIRNAVLAAAAEIPNQQQPRLTFAVLLQAIAREYRKSGKPLPPKLLNQLNQVVPGQVVPDQVLMGDVPLVKAVLS
ncbi:MAG: ATP-binding protein [Cellvibrio sp.]|uniref:ATP-binding protein n=1 Tax=Cellvibrio sp. TaxID=1965322 RepID=UPI0027257E49|nr:ATP-binding protein [Cellvibrio sp.]